MKNQILYTEITTALEDIAQALRKYGSGSLYINVSIVTNEEEPGLDGYSIRLHEYNNELPLILAEAGTIIRDEDGKIAKVERNVGGWHD